MSKFGALPGEMIAMTDLSDHEADLGDHDQPIQLIATDRSGRPPWA
jgi:hypothetical protein